MPALPASTGARRRVDTARVAGLESDMAARSGARPSPVDRVATPFGLLHVSHFVAVESH